MKKETKELIEYMYDKFADRIAITRSLSPEQRKSAEVYNTRRDKIQKFLKSLPELVEKREADDKLAKAKELLNACIFKARGNVNPSWSELITDIEQFLREE